MPLAAQAGAHATLVGGGAPEKAGGGVWVGAQPVLVTVPAGIDQATSLLR